MKLACNRSNISQHARALLGSEWTPERESELIRECLYGFVREPGHISHSRAAHIGRIDKILGNHGCEGILADADGNDLRGTCSMTGVKWDVHYSNTGDTYGTTVMYVNGKLFIGDWGGLFE